MKIGLIILGVYLIIQPLLLASLTRYIKSDNLEFLSAISFGGVVIGFVCIGCGVYN